MTPRYSRISYTAPILGGYKATADFAPSDGEWRVLAIPGTPSRPYMFTRMLRQAPPDLEVVVPNRPGYGGPNWGANVRAPVLDFNDQVTAFRSFFDNNDGKKTIVVGVSYGGALALKCALDFPGEIAGAVTVAMLVTEPRRYVRAAMRLANVWGIRHVLPHYLHNARAEIAGRRPQIGSVLEQLKTLKTPVTILHGNLDTLVPLSDAHRLHNYFAPGADVRFELINGGTHYLELQSPQRVYGAIRDVIERAQRSS